MRKENSVFFHLLLVSICLSNGKEQGEKGQDNPYQDWKLRRTLRRHFQHDLVPEYFGSVVHSVGIEGHVLVVLEPDLKLILWEKKGARRGNTGCVGWTVILC